MRLKINSFGFRLWSYFALFTALIFTVLWLLQTVFLQNFYDSMIIKNTRSVAEKIISDAKNEDINSEIDEIAHKNSIIVYVTDVQGNVLYVSDEFKGMRKREFSLDDESKGKKADKHQSG